ncbi:NAD(P)H-dependent oxidoreductase [Campylobacter mucosalis]|uniref:NAD(P)H-dependent oxidoreductase n=1 Tax=Campylobacter mucosalis TaxID=202 RepID=UPI00146FCB62|nr:NAD(P)H-dependent oxidoreductase [Campylobacter mucosalis]
MKDYLDIINFRHACKIFDENKKISKGDFEYILEAGRLSPSSTGLEQWDFVIVQNKELREKIREKSWNQVQVTSCSHLVVILAKISDVKADSKYVSDMIARRPDKTPEAHAQCMFAALNMMNAAAFKGIDSCPIEGFEREAIGEILNIDTKKHRVALLVPFGYRLNEQPTKYRRSLDDIVSWIE